MTRIGHGSVKASFVLMAVLALVGGATASARAVGSTVIEVFPGANAINIALHAAHPGDTLNVHAGTYGENVVISKANISIQSAGDGPVTVDGGCADSTFDVHADGVSIAGLEIIGGDFFNVDYTFVSHGTVSGNRIKSTCPDAEYGVNLFDTGPMLVERNRVTGFTDAGIYIGGIIDTGAGTLMARLNDLFRNDRGIIVEDSVGVSLLVRYNIAHDNFNDGIFLHNSDGILVQRNTVFDNTFAGIELDALSDHNLIGSNRARGNLFDLANGGGAGNCFINNTYTTSWGTIDC